MEKSSKNVQGFCFVNLAGIAVNSGRNDGPIERKLKVVVVRDFYSIYPLRMWAGTRGGGTLIDLI